nr:hypothetical protein [Pectobacterium polaris]
MTHRYFLKNTKIQPFLPHNNNLCLICLRQGSPSVHTIFITCAPMRLFQAFLLFLFVKERAEHVVRALNVTAKRSDIAPRVTGFGTDTLVIITVEQGQLLIRIVDE